MQFSFETLRRAVEFGVRRRQTIVDVLGAGKDGTVFRTSQRHAVKLLENEEVYDREKQAYRRLLSRGVRFAGDFEVPRLVGYYDDLLVIEMTVVRPPFIVDFASAHLDEPPDFPADVTADYHDRIRDDFGDRAADVFALLHDLAERHGVYMLDARPANIQF